MSTESKRRRFVSGAFEVAGVGLVSVGAFVTNTALGFVVTGAACLWMGYSTS